MGTTLPYNGIFRADIILHIEDEPTWQKNVFRWLDSYANFPEAGAGLNHVESKVTNELDEITLEAEIARIESQMTGGLTVVTVISGQIARTLISKYLPSVIISDTGFPLNGEVTVRWLVSHGLQNFPLIGLSGTTLGEIKSDVKDFFVTRNARYFYKDELELMDFVKQVEFNRAYAIQHHEGIVNREAPADGRN